jgi:DNA-directed RNA polymerase specialized sigma24 family protein
LAEGLSYKEAGEIVGKSELAVSKTVSRFRQGLKSKRGIFSGGNPLGKKEVS